MRPALRWIVLAPQQLYLLPREAQDQSRSKGIFKNGYQSFKESNSQGQAIPSFFIFKAKQFQSFQFEKDLPLDWHFTLSSNGWTTNEIGLRWIVHFNTYTADHVRGWKKLLALDGHESHKSLKFLDFCAQHDIVCLFMPQHSSHILHPSNAGCFGLLKQAYERQIEHIVRGKIFHITKLEFLAAFKDAYQSELIRTNIFV